MMLPEARSLRPRRQPRWAGRTPARSGRSEARAERVIRATSGRRAAERVRPLVVTLAATQEGIVTLEQIAQRLGHTTAEVGLRAMAAREEIEQVLPTVWVHAATGRLPGWDRVLEAQARWLALEPDLTLTQRSRRDRDADDTIAVIGGGAACAKWGIEGLVWGPELYVPVPTDRVRSDDEVEVVVEPVPRADVVWIDRFPYLTPEATLARGYDATGDLDRVAEALSSAMWRLYPLRPDRLRHHFVVAQRRTADTTRDDDTIYEFLIGRAGGWPRQAEREYGA